MGIPERIKAIEEEMARTQKNKATSYHLGLLKARIAKLRSELLLGSVVAALGNHIDSALMIYALYTYRPPGQRGAAKPGEGFDVQKSGDCRVSIVGFPSVGKSTFLSTVTTTQSAVAAYEFTTLTVRLRMISMPSCF